MTEPGPEESVVIGIVIVSHSHGIAEGVAELAREMGGPDVRLETAGGLDMPDHPIGTDAVLVMQAIERAWSDDGVLVLMDLGSAVLSAEMALDLLAAGAARHGSCCARPRWSKARWRPPSPRGWAPRSRRSPPKREAGSPARSRTSARRRDEAARASRTRPSGTPSRSG